MPPAVGENIPTAGGLTIYRGITLLFRSLNRRSLNNKLHASIHSICLTTVRSISAFIRIQRLNPIQYISQIILKGTLQLAGTLFFKLLRTVSQFFRPIGQLVNTINNLAASRFQIRSSACQRRSSICQCRAPLASVDAPLASVEAPLFSSEAPLAREEVPFASVEAPLASWDAPLAT
mgnify:CR=1 FL=1